MSAILLIEERMVQEEEDLIDLEVRARSMAPRSLPPSLPFSAASPMLPSASQPISTTAAEPLPLYEAV
jgi:hypothetical protein